jgi:hypothetical protein
MSVTSGKDLAKSQGARSEPPQRPHAGRQVASAHENVLALQRAAGNRAVAGLRARSAGKPLDPSTRHEMESRFRHDFGDVRVHNNAEVAISAELLGANAWTAGNDIVFADGHYSSTSRGKTLLAHELAHVVQQRRGGAKLRTFDTASAAEKDAAHAVDQFSGSGPVSVSAATGAGVARDEAEEPWWKQRLNPIYQRSLEVLPKSVAEKLEQANAVAKQFVAETGIDDAGLNQAVKTAEPVLQPIADYLGVKSDAPDGPKADDSKPVTWLGTPPIDVQLKQYKDQQRQTELDQQATKAGLDETAPLPPPDSGATGGAAAQSPLGDWWHADPEPTEFETKLQSGKPFQTKIHPKPDIDPRQAVWLGERPTEHQMKDMRFEDVNDPAKAVYVDDGKAVDLTVDSDSTMPIRDPRTHELLGYRIRHGDTMTVLDRNGEARGSRNLESPLEHPAVDPIDIAFLAADLGPIAAKGLQVGAKALTKAMIKSGTRELAGAGGEETAKLLGRESSDLIESQLSQVGEFPELDLGAGPANDVEPSAVPSGQPANDVVPDEDVTHLDDYRTQDSEVLQEGGTQLAAGQDFASVPEDATTAATKKSAGTVLPVKRVWVARRSGPSLENQSAFSGSRIRYKGNKSYIKEAELDGVFFDRIRKNVLGEVKGDYSVPIRIGSQHAADRLIAEARRQIAVATKYGLLLEWHVRAADLAGFKNVVGVKYPNITFVPY